MYNEFNNKYIEEKIISKKFIIIYTILLIILIYITALAIYFSIENINNEEITVPKTIISNIKEENKNVAQDIKYAINSYDETYDINSIKTINTYDIDGKVSTDDSILNPTYRIHFIQIDGLKNSDIQYKINEKLKQKAYTLAFNDSFVNSSVTGNFANILSVLLSSEKDVETINIDLSTGKEIPLNDIFISSATVNFYLTSALYKELAKQNLYQIENANINTLDMKQIDTSNYEDKYMILINNFYKNINNLKYTITPNSINIYGLIDKNIIDTNNVQKLSININLIDYINEIAMYKRFLTEKSIYSDDSIGIKNTINFTNNIIKENGITKINYGKMQNNIFLEEYLFGNYEQPEFDVAKEYIKKLSDEQKENLANQTSNSRGTFYQRAYSILNNTENNYLVITMKSYQASCSINYFNSNAFLDYIKLKSIANPDSLIGFEQYMNEIFPNLEILPVKIEEVYIKPTGEFLGNTENEAKEKLEQERLEQERLEKEHLEKERLEQERLEQERIKAEIENQMQNQTNQFENSINTNTVSPNIIIHELDQNGNLIIVNGYNTNAANNNNIIFD